MNRLVQIIFLIAGATLWQIVFDLPEEADTYFIMNIGRYVLEHGFPHVAPFTIHENLQLVAQQWLSGIIFLKAYETFGVDGLRLTDAFFAATLVLIHWRLCLFVSCGNKTLSFVLSFVVGLLAMPQIVPRPQIISATLLLIEVFLLEKFTRTKDFKFLLPLPLLSTLLINFHAAIWIMSLVVCLPFLFVKDLRHAKFLLAAMGGIFLFGLINPYGVDAMTYVLRSYGINLINTHVAEMFTPTAHDFIGKFFYVSEAFVILSLAKFKVPLRYIFLSGGIIFMAIMHERNLILFYFLATFPLAFAWKNFSTEKFKTRKLMMSSFLLLVAVNTIMITMVINDGLGKISSPLEILFFVSTLFALYNLLVLRAEKSLFHTSILPRKNLSLFVSALVISGIFFVTVRETQPKTLETFSNAIRFLLKTERPENISLYVHQGIGGLAGSFGVKYYIDSRSEVFLPANNGQKNILAEYLDFIGGKLYYKDFFSRYDFTHIILLSAEPFIYNQLSNDKNFRVIYESEHVEGYQVIRCRIFIPPKNEE